MTQLEILREHETYILRTVTKRKILMCLLRSTAQRFALSYLSKSIFRTLLMSYIDGGTWLWDHTAYLKILYLVRGDLRGKSHRLLVAQNGNVGIIVAGLTFVQAPCLQ